jgi:hypothetical protein
LPRGKQDSRVVAGVTVNDDMTINDDGFTLITWQELYFYIGI